MFVTLRELHYALMFKQQILQGDNKRFLVLTLYKLTVQTYRLCLPTAYCQEYVLDHVTQPGI